MYRPSGTASTMQMAVTLNAIPTVRRVAVRNTASVSTRTMLSPV